MAAQAQRVTTGDSWSQQSPCDGQSARAQSPRRAAGGAAQTAAVMGCLMAPGRDGGRGGGDGILAAAAIDGWLRQTQPEFVYTA